MTRHGYECPDCEQPSCPGYGCFGSIRLEQGLSDSIRKSRKQWVICAACYVEFRANSRNTRTCSAECRRDNRNHVQRVRVSGAA